MKKIRDSRFEMLRIISMIFIVMYHYTLYGNWTENIRNTFKIQFFRPWGQVGVGLFVMITSYFISNKASSLNLSWLRNKKIWITTIFYSWMILLITFILNPSSLKLKEAIFAVFPVIFDEYWFISSYIVLIFLSPFLNSLVQNCDKRQFKIYIGIIIVAADIMPYLQNTNPNAPLGGVFSVGAMLAPYLIAAYVKKYNLKVNIFQSCIIVTLGIFLEYASVYIMSKHGDPGRFTGGFLPLITAIGIFFMFLNIKPLRSRMINWLASGVLASYLITEHPIFRLVFWHQILNIAKFQDPVWLFILMGGIIAILTVICCSIIDHLCRLIYGKLVNYLKV